MREQSQLKTASIADLKSAASGRWLAILADAGIAVALLDGRGHACPQCGGTDRFAAWPDVSERGAVHCRHCFTRGCSPRPGDGISTLQWILRCDTATACRWLRDWLGIPTKKYHKVQETNDFKKKVGNVADKASEARFDRFAEECRNYADEWILADISSPLRIPVPSLRRLGVGWSRTDRASTWPMVNSTGAVVGIRMRALSSGQKWAVKGSKAGMFVPADLAPRPSRLFIAEGPTDTAAILSLGLDAIGRSSATGPLSLEVEVVSRLQPIECVLIADNDEPGRRGAAALAERLVACHQTVRLMSPPSNYGDVRDWIASGASLETLVIAAGFTRPLNISLKTGEKV